MRISGITYVPRKTHRIRNTFITLLIVAALVILSVFIISASTGWKLVHPERIPLPSSISSGMPPYKEATFLDSDKELRLKGWYFQVKGSTKTVIFAHGYERNRLQFGEKTLDMVRSFHGSGYNVLLFDFRASGVSEGRVVSISINEKKDLLGAVEYAKSQGSTKVAVIGFSMGASTSILAAADSPYINAVIAESPFADLELYLKDHLDKWSGLPSFPFNSTILFSVKLVNKLDPSDSSPKTVIPRVAPRPVLFIHSLDDNTIPAFNSKELYDIYSKAGGNAAEYWEVSGAGHMGIFEKNPGQYMTRVLSFLDKALSQ